MSAPNSQPLEDGTRSLDVFAREPRTDVGGPSGGIREFFRELAFRVATNTIALLTAIIVVSLMAVGHEWRASTDTYVAGGLAIALIVIFGEYLRYFVISNDSGYETIGRPEIFGHPSIGDAPPEYFELLRRGVRGGKIEDTARRLRDILLSAVIALVLMPMLLVITALIKATSPGPVLFRQKRLGLNERPFVFYKFRTMAHDADEKTHRQFAAMFLNSEVPDGDGTDDRGAEARERVFRLKRDPRVTRIGAWLRMTGLDELPQLWNVVRGDMSLVGPRPPIAYEIENYQEWQKCRMRVPPGLTGVWQVSGRVTVSFDEMVRMDIRYIYTRSLWLDAIIMLKTIPVALKGTSGY